MKNLVEKYIQSVDWKMMFPDLTEQVIERAIAIQQIPAPTFAEQDRAAFVAAQMRAEGLQNVQMDELHNVFGRLPGLEPQKPGVMLVAHTDTVFPAETSLAIQRGSGVIYGPGLGDNSMGVAGILGLAAVLRQYGITPERDLWLVATSREEGLGDLGGMRAAFATLRPHISLVINVEGLAYGHLYHAGIAVRRLHITVRTEGGHSWLHFGRPSAVHALMRLGAKIDSISVPAMPRTTYNIGVIEGGQSVNSIASNAGLWLDMRSESRDNLEKLEREVRAHINSLTTPTSTSRVLAAQTTAGSDGGDIQVEVEVVGDRPAGYLPPEHPLIQGALSVLAHLGLRGSLETGSTDGNIPLAAGCPAVTVGITRGGNAHRLDEFIEIAPVEAGMKQLITLTLAAAASLAVEAV